MMKNIKNWIIALLILLLALQEIRTLQLLQNAKRERMEYAKNVFFEGLYQGCVNHFLRSNRGINYYPDPDPCKETIIVYLKAPGPLFYGYCNVCVKFEKEEATE